MPLELTCQSCNVRLRVSEAASAAWYTCPRCLARIDAELYPGTTAMTATPPAPTDAGITARPAYRPASARGANADRDVRQDTRVVGIGLVIVIGLLAIGGSFFTGLTLKKGYDAIIPALLCTGIGAMVPAFLLTLLVFAKLSRPSESTDTRGRMVLGMVATVVSCVVGMVAFFVMIFLTCMSFAGGANIGR